MGAYMRREDPRPIEGGEGRLMARHLLSLSEREIEGSNQQCNMTYTDDVMVDITNDQVRRKTGVWLARIEVMF